MNTNKTTLVYDSAYKIAAAWLEEHGGREILVKGVTTAIAGVCQHTGIELRKLGHDTSDEDGDEAEALRLAVVVAVRQLFPRSSEVWRSPVGQFRREEYLRVVRHLVGDLNLPDDLS